MSDHFADIADRITASAAQLADEEVAFLQQLVRIPSVTGDEFAVQQAIWDRFRAANLDTRVEEPQNADLAPWAEHITAVPSYHHRPNVIGIRRGSGGGRSLILNAHIDTVELGDREHWNLDPLGGDVVDGRLYGRGSCDMKGGLVSNFFALLALEHAGYAPQGDVILESTVSEEDGGAGALSAVLTGPKADAVIISEPTQRAIIPAQGGSLMFRIFVEGRSAHACMRNEGQSAIESWAVLHQGLLAFEDRRNREITDPLYAMYANKIPINVGTLRSGNWPSSVPEWLVAEGRAGMVPGEDLEGFKRRFRDEVAAIASRDPWLSDHPPRIEWMDGQFAAAGIASDHPLVGTIAAAHREQSGSDPTIEGVTYGADMRHYILAGDMPCLLYGAGDVRLAHAPNESIPIEELLGATATLALTIAKWCGVQPAHH